mmetsp:Transcript_43690/g.68405  ORF Transcript_43690/g.68405 Transcript_43690/m.68405 type:complete len:183 (+) Transcript_43690:155-703(+)
MEPASGTKEKAYQLMEANNPNNVRGPADWLNGLSGQDRRWVPYNGAFSATQVDWIRREIQSSDARKEKVIVLSHIALAPGACAESCLVWNYQEVLEICQKSESVVLVLAGHDHEGGYVCDEAGVHHVTIASPLEVVADQLAFGVIDVHQNRLVIRGTGKVVSRELPFRNNGRLTLVEADAGD